MECTRRSIVSPLTDSICPPHLLQYWLYSVLTQLWMYYFLFVVKIWQLDTMYNVQFQCQACMWNIKFDTSWCEIVSCRCVCTSSYKTHSPLVIAHQLYDNMCWIVSDNPLILDFQFFSSSKLLLFSVLSICHILRYKQIQK